MLSRWSSAGVRLDDGEPPRKRQKKNLTSEVPATPLKKSVSWAADENLVQVRTFRKMDSIAVCLAPFVFCVLAKLELIGKESSFTNCGKTREPTSYSTETMGRR